MSINFNANIAIKFCEKLLENGVADDEIITSLDSEVSKTNELLNQAFENVSCRHSGDAIFLTKLKEVKEYVDSKLTNKIAEIFSMKVALMNMNADAPIYRIQMLRLKSECLKITDQLENRHEASFSSPCIRFEFVSPEQAAAFGAETPK